MTDRIDTLHHYRYIVIISNPTDGHLKIMTFVTDRIDTLHHYIYIIIIGIVIIATTIIVIMIIVTLFIFSVFTQLMEEAYKGWHQLEESMVSIL